MHPSPSALRERPTRPFDVDGDVESGTVLRIGPRMAGRESAGARTDLIPRVASHRASRRRAGFLLSEFFALAEGDVTGEVLDRGPGRRYDAISTTSLTDLTMALLLAAIEGRRLDGAIERMELDGFVVDGSLHGPWLTRLPDTLRDALSDADPDDLRLYASRWMGAVELAHADGRAMAALLFELAGLARSAKLRGDSLYLWTSL